MTGFDVVVIGSGPAAVAALDAVRRPLRVAVVDGAVPGAANNARLNPKIQAVASTEGKVAGLAEFVSPAAQGKALYSTAEVGGLANYWGQQFLAAHPNDPWPSGLFTTHADFLSECAEVEASFQIEGGQPLANPVVSSAGYTSFTPRLVVGAKGSSGNAFSAMKYVFRKIETAKNLTTFTSRAASFGRIAGGWRVLLDNGDEISAARIVLAAGVFGNARILLRSYPDLGAARFSDHAPWMVYTLGLPSLAPARAAPGNGHFNIATLEKTENDRSAVYASVYDMRNSDLNLITASTFGFTSRLLGGLRPPRIVSLLKPVQVWTTATTGWVELHTRNGATVHSSPASEVNRDNDRGLKTTIDVLRALGAHILKVSRTPPGYGFHYHSLEFQAAGSAFKPIVDLLLDRTGGEVVCVDASTLLSIGCRPHTLTAMASARRAMGRQF